MTMDSQRKEKYNEEEFNVALKQWVQEHPPVDFSKPGITVPDDWEWE